MMSWLLPVVPHEDELLSSFLVRAATVHGQSPYRFARYHGGGVSFWNRDVDRIASTDLLQRLADESGLAPERVDGMTVQSWERSLAGDRVQGTGPWILAMGIYHRTRRAHGLQFCSVCLGESACYLRKWRFAWMTRCPVHKTVLQDRCEQCGEPVMLHKSTYGFYACHKCGRDRRASMGEDAQKCSLPTVLQEKFSNVLFGQKVLIGNVELSATEFAVGVRWLVAVLSTRFRVPLLVNAADAKKSPGRAVQLEWASVASRDRVFLLIDRLLDNWPTRFISVAKFLGITQRTLPIKDKGPTWIVEAWKQLDKGSPWREVPLRPNRSTSVVRLRKELYRLHKKKDGNWRGERAASLLRVMRAK